MCVRMYTCLHVCRVQTPVCGCFHKYVHIHVEVWDWCPESFLITLLPYLLRQGQKQIQTLSVASLALARSYSCAAQAPVYLARITGEPSCPPAFVLFAPHLSPEPSDTWLFEHFKKNLFGFIVLRNLSSPWQGKCGVRSGCVHLSRNISFMSLYPCNKKQNGMGTLKSSPPVAFLCQPYPYPKRFHSLPAGYH